MKTKFLIYTSNLEMNPRTMSDVMAFATSTPKMYITNVELSETLSDVETGDKLITKKGNSIYVIRAIKHTKDQWTEEERNLVDEWTRSYGLRSMNITGVDQITRFETWCKSARPLVESDRKIENSSNLKKNQQMKKNFTLAAFGEKVKAMLLPQKAEEVRLSMNGDVVVCTSEGWVSIDAQNQLNSYPEELTLPIPAYTIAKPASSIVAGDVIEHCGKYYKVTKVDGTKLGTISYTGNGHAVHVVNDFLMGTTVRTIVPLTGLCNAGGAQQLPGALIMLSLLKEDGNGSDSIKSLLPFLFMGGMGGANFGGMNPAMMMLLLNGHDGDINLESLLPFMMMGGQIGAFGAAPAAAPAQAGGLFSNFFSGFGAPVAQPAAAPAVKKAPAKKKATKAEGEA